jgi:signal transduction histidine kinase
LEITVTTISTIFAAYIAANVLGGGVIFLAEHLPFAVVQWAVFALSLVDGIFFGSLLLVSGGHDSPLFWLFVVLIIRNAASTPPAWSQLALNLCICLIFATASFFAIGLNTQINEELYNRPAHRIHAARHSVSGSTQHLSQGDTGLPVTEDPGSPAEAVLIRLMVLVLVGVWIYALQVLLEKQRLATEEAREFSERESQLRSAGRLAAEFAHQIKNPLAILNNATYSLKNNLMTGKGDPQRHLQIMQEEITRADQIITRVMGYAELTESRVEKLDLSEEMERAIRQTFPTGLSKGMTIELDLSGPFPPILMQRRHLSEIFLNLMQNAKEAMHGAGKVFISARVRADLSVEIVVADTGPGIAPEHIARIFEAYYTTKERGTGLGLAIVKNNTELYGGTVRAESELGKGSRFIIEFPARASVKFRS